MKRLSVLLISLALPFSAFCAEEDQLLQVLQSNGSLQEKDAAVARLKWVGTARSVPALAELLTNDDFSQTARYALESMQAPEAETVLRQALARTTGSNEVGIIGSLGMRRDASAVPDLASLLSNSDSAVAKAAADALGHIGGADAVQVLETAWSTSKPGKLHDAETDGLLAGANRLLTTGARADAAKIFAEIRTHEKEEYFQYAAFRGQVLAAEDGGIALVLKAIQGTDVPNQGAALQLAVRMPGADATRALAGLLPSVSPTLQLALLQCLGQRGDPAAEGVVVPMLDNSDSSVRLAAILALGSFGDDAAVLPLASKAGVAAGPERTAIRQALVDLNHGPITEAMLKALPSAPVPVQLELVRALGERGDAVAVPQMLELARSPDDAIRAAALQALAVLAGQAQVANLVQMVVNSTNDDGRSEIADALGSICERVQSQNGVVDAAPLVQAVQTAPMEARLAILGVCGSVSDPRIREALLAAASDSDARIREAAVRALCATHDPKLLPDVLRLATDSSEKKFRVLAVAGCVRLTTQDDDAHFSTPEKLDTFKSLLATPLTAPEKRQVLSGLGTVQDGQALALVTPLLDDASVRTEAAQAVIHIAGSISAARPQEAGAALKKVLAMSSINRATQRSAEQVYKKIQ